VSCDFTPFVKNSHRFSPLLLHTTPVKRVREITLHGVLFPTSLLASLYLPSRNHRGIMPHHWLKSGAAPDANSLVASCGCPLVGFAQGHSTLGVQGPAHGSCSGQAIMGNYGFSPQVRERHSHSGSVPSKVKS
jgi:hypothetical protein